MRKFILILLAVVLVFPFAELDARAAGRLQDPGEKIVIVIDPGHGGKNRGTQSNNHEEALMTMTTALAMYTELQQYDDVEVYLTRTEDITMSLAERAKFAKSVDADFLFSIHYNASENHELYGSEVWTSLFAPYNGYGYQFGHIFLTDMRDRGLLIRGVKTRLGDKNLDYYGIIRESVALEIPAVIIEHCHVDEAHDEGYCDSDEKLQAFGKADATAVAKYFGLKSTALNVDYSGYQLAEAGADSNVKVTNIDSTKPDFCELQFQGIDYENSILSFRVYGTDQDSPLLYYSYSIDGGATFSAREAWPDTDTLTGVYADSFTLELPIQAGVKPEVVLRAYNQYDLYTESNHYISEETFPVSAPISDNGGTAATSPASQPEGNNASAPAANGETGSDSATDGGTSLAGNETANNTNNSSNTSQGGIVPVNAGALGASGQETESGNEFSAVNIVMICLAFLCILLIMLAVFQGLSYYKHKKGRQNH